MTALTAAAVADYLATSHGIVVTPARATQLAALVEPTAAAMAAVPYPFDAEPGTFLRALELLAPTAGDR